MPGGLGGRSGSGVPSPAQAVSLAQELLNQGIPTEIIPQSLVQANLVSSYAEGVEIVQGVEERREAAEELSAEVFGPDATSPRITDVQDIGGVERRVTVAIDAPAKGSPYYGIIVVDVRDQAALKDKLERFADDLEADYAEHYAAGE